MDLDHREEWSGGDLEFKIIDKNEVVWNQKILTESAGDLEDSPFIGMRM